MRATLNAIGLAFSKEHGLPKSVLDDLAAARLES
jgi:hypothetical protein